MAASFSACPTCGVRLSVQSMQFHQQLCGKQKSSTPRGPSLGSSHHAIASNSTSGKRQGLSAHELDALRQEVYGGRTSPGVPQRGAARASHPELREPSPEARAEQPPRASGGSRASSPSTSTATAGRRHIDVREDLTARLERSDVSRQSAEGVGHGHSARDQRMQQQPLPVLESASAAEVAELRALVQRMSDELRRVRDDVVFLQRDNAALRDELADFVQPQEADRDTMKVMQQDVRELRRKVDGLSALLDDHETNCDARIRGLQEAAHRRLEPSRGNQAVPEQQQPQRREEYVYGQSHAGAKRNIERDVRPTSGRPPSQRYEQAADAGTGASYTPRPAVTPQRATLGVIGGRNGPQSQMREDEEYPDVSRPVPARDLPIDTSMRKETENLVSKALQRRAPASAVYSTTTRSSSRTSESSGLDGYFTGALGGGDLVYSRQGSRN